SRGRDGSGGCVGGRGGSGRYGGRADERPAVGRGWCRRGRCFGRSLGGRGNEARFEGLHVDWLGVRQVGDQGASEVVGLLRSPASRLGRRRRRRLRPVRRGASTSRVNGAVLGPAVRSCGVLRFTAILRLAGVLSVHGVLRVAGVRLRLVLCSLVLLGFVLRGLVLGAFVLRGLVLGSLVLRSFVLG